jgi:Tol biopolymer transport system component
LQLPESPLLRNLERKSGLIVYLGADGNIYTIDQAGGRKNAITDDADSTISGSEVARLYQFPTWAPNGRRVAFVGLDQSQTGVENVTLYTASPDGGDQTENYQSVDQFPFYLYWSPDSEQITFLTTLPDQGIALKVVPAEGGETETLGTGTPFYWDWAPDNRTLLIHSGGSAQTSPEARLALLDVDRDSEEDLSIRPSTFQAPAWSPNSDEFLLGAESESGQESILLTDRSGDIAEELVEVEGPVFFDWSPDGERLAYLSTDPEALEGLAQVLTILDPDQPDSEQRATEELVVAFFWAPDSRRIAYFSPAVFTPTPVPGQETPSQQLLFLRLYVMDIESGESEELALFRPTQDFLNILPYFDQYARSATIWSPDSRNLVIPANNQQGQSNIFIVEAAGSLEPRLITDGTLAFWSFR